MQFVYWILFFLVIGAFAFYRLPRWIWLLGTAVLLLIYSYFHLFYTIDLVVLWAILVALAIVLCIPAIRIAIFSKPFCRWFRKQQPELSSAEREVLEAGGLWWEQEFFKGRPDWQKLLELPKPELTTEEQAFLDHQVTTLCQMLDDWTIVHDDKDLPQAAWDYIRQERFWGLVVDKTYGGHGFSALAHSTIVTKIASRSYTAALTVMVPNSLGPAELIAHYGTEQQKDYYLPRLANGEEVPCFALTAQNAGSDATSIFDSGVVCKGEFEGKEIIGIRLNINKRYITLAPVTTLIGLAFKMYDPEHLLGEQDNIGITLALVPADTNGIGIGLRHYPLHLAFLNGPITGKDVFIPLEWIIGGVEKRGHGWQMLMECLSVGRGISLPALSAATSQLCYRMTGAYAQLREQFKRPIGQFDGVKAVLARISGFAYLCESTRWFTAQAVDQNARPSIASAMTKYHLTELARKAVSDAMDVHAGRGIQTGPRNYLANMYNGMPISITVEGANILTRNLIIFGQGALRCHPFVRDEIQNADINDVAKLKKFDALIVSHIGFFVSNAVRMVAYGLTGGHWICTPKKVSQFTSSVRQLTRMSSAFTFLTDMAMALLGQQLKMKETLSARLGDVLSHLYLASAVLKHFKNQGVEDPQEQDLVQWCLEYCLYQIGEAIKHFCDNFPYRWLGRLAYYLIFPLSRGYRYPSDRLSFKVADTMQSTANLRERLTQHIFVGDHPDDPTGRVELAFQALVAAQPLIATLMRLVKEKQIKRQSTLAATAEIAYNEGLISQQECQQILDLEELRDDAISVDAF